MAKKQTKNRGQAKQYSIAQAREHLPRVVHEVERGATVELTRRGKPVAVMISKADHSRLRGEGSGFWEAVTEFRRKVDLKGLGLNPDEIWGGVRDRSPGRDVAR